MKKRVLSVLLAALMVFTALSALIAAPVGADEYDDYYDDDYLWYNKRWLYTVNEDNTVTIIFCKPKSGGKMTIPSTISGLPVTELDGLGVDNPAGQQSMVFASSSVIITSLIVPDSVIRIAQGAFNHMTDLTEVKLGNNLTAIDEYVFHGCSSLQEIIIPASVTTIGDYAFMECGSLQTVYYAGTREQWNGISIGIKNDGLASATIYYNHPTHSTEYVPTTATCTEDGVKAHYQCTICGKKFRDSAATKPFYKGYEDALDHEGGDWVVTTPPTCTEAGVETQLCSRCGDYTDATRPVAAIGHDYEPVSTTAPNCTEPGTVTCACSRCGDSYTVEGQTEPVHLFGDWTLTSAPRCTESGVETRYCVRCGTPETRAVDPTGHDFSGWTVTTPPTCTGYGEETGTCAVCGASDTRPVDPTGHKYTGWTVVTWEDCTTDGEETRRCLVCGTVDTKITPATGHSFVDGFCEYCSIDDPNAPKITVSDTWSKKRGDRIELTVSLEDNPGVSSLMLGLSYDDTAFMLEDVTNGELFDEISDLDLNGGSDTVCFDAASNVSGDGALMTLTFTVTDQACTDWYYVGVFVRGAAVDENGDDIDFLWYDGIVDVTVYGDADRNGGIDVMDVILISQNILDNTVYVSPGADANGDGTVDIFDVILISQYILDPTVVLGP